MKLRLIILAAVIIIAGIAFSYIYSGKNRGGISHSDPTSNIAPVSLYASEQASAASKSASPRRGDASNSNRYSPQALPITAIKNSDTRLIALSPEEAAWLDAHYFPTPSEIENLANYSAEDLLHRARDLKDPKAAALLGDRRMMEGDTSGALSAFALSASLGSIYGHEGMAVATPMSGLHGRALTNDALAILVAGLEVARILGDHRATELMRKYAPNLDRNVYGNAIQLQVTEYMRQIGSDAQARGIKAIGPDPRPNAHLWEKIDQAPANDTTTVEVFTRPNSYP